MVEPVSLTIGAIVAALVAKAAEKGEDAAVDAGAGVLSRVGGWLRDRFTRHGDEPAGRALARVQDAPDSPTRVRELAAVVDDRASADGVFKSELEKLVDEANAAGVDVATITQTAWGNQNVQIAGNQGAVNVAIGQTSPFPQ